MTLEKWSAGYRAGTTRLWATDLVALRWLAQLRLLTTAQLHALAAPELSLRSIHDSIGRLCAAGLLDSVPLQSKAKRDSTRVWFLTDQGLEAAAPEHPRHYRITRLRAGNTKQAHSLAVSDVAVAFATHLRQHEHTLDPGDCEAEFSHVMSDRGAVFSNLLVSDLRLRAMLHEPDGDIHITRLIELDRGNQSIPQLIDKIRNYIRVFHYKTPDQRARGDAGLPAWRLSYTAFPKVMFVFAGLDDTRLRRRQEQFVGLLREDTRLSRPLLELRVRCTTLPDLLRRGPLQPVFTGPDTDDQVDLLNRRPRSLALLT